jgi:TctA family transporter
MAPLLLAFIPGDRLESSFRLSLTMSGGSYTTFLDAASVVVLGSVLGLLRLIQALAWEFGYRKSVAERSGAGVDKYSI